jgi:hypothetical protein
MTKRNPGLLRALLLSLAAVSFLLVMCVFTATAQNGSAYFYPGNLG